MNAIRNIKGTPSYRRDASSSYVSSVWFVPFTMAPKEKVAYLSRFPFSRLWLDIAVIEWSSLAVIIHILVSHLEQNQKIEPALNEESKVTRSSFENLT